jgi:hypothetical protein
VWLQARGRGQQGAGGGVSPWIVSP